MVDPTRWLVVMSLLFLVPRTVLAQSVDEPVIIVDRNDEKVISQGDAGPSGIAETPKPRAACEDRCGNGRCEEIVCMAVGCPCAESYSSCPEDCR
jgi:hypothetical protein